MILAILLGVIGFVAGYYIGRVMNGSAVMYNYETEGRTMILDMLKKIFAVSMSVVIVSVGISVMTSIGILVIRFIKYCMGR